jgi:ubiquinone/menaquinone biosynthesis C-methylase UbiE
VNGVAHRNPFLTKPEVKAVDRFEAKTRGYRYVTEKLVEGIRKVEGRILDFGCGSGNSTLALLDKYQGRYNHVVAIDQSEEQLKLAKIKFGLTNADLNDVDDEELREFFIEFKQEALYLRKGGGIGFRVSFLEESVENVRNCIRGELIELAVGNHVWHWLIKQGVEDKAMDAVYNVLEKGGILAFNTSANFMNPVEHKIEDVSVLYHPLIRRFLEVLSKKIKETTGADVSPTHPEPIIEKDAKIKQFEDAGFEPVEYGEYLVSIGRDPETGEDNFEEATIMLCDYHIRALPDHLAIFADVEITDEEKGFIIEAARAETLEKAGADLEHKGHIYDVNPKFVFRKT